jgi:hypothetical protein
VLEIEERWRTLGLTLMSGLMGLSPFMGEEKELYSIPFPGEEMLGPSVVDVDVKEGATEPRRKCPQFASDTIALETRAWARSELVAGMEPVRM